MGLISFTLKICLSDQKKKNFLLIETFSKTVALSKLGKNISSYGKTGDSSSLYIRVQVLTDIGAGESGCFTNWKPNQ